MKDKVKFEWDKEKNLENQRKHGISFRAAKKAFEDPNRIVIEDVKHSTTKEKRLFCIGKVGAKIVTIRFTYRGEKIRIIGAGAWRDYRKRYVQPK